VSDPRQQAKEYDIMADTYLHKRDEVETLTNNILEGMVVSFDPQVAEYIVKGLQLLWDDYNLQYGKCLAWREGCLRESGSPNERMDQCQGGCDY
jgi:hypothetical protein